jgi:hypothetical protein
MAASNPRKSHIEAWQRSGLSQAAYCRQVGIHPGTFSAWVRADRVLFMDTGRQLIPVRVEPQDLPGSSEALRLHLSGDRQLELPSTVSPRWLAELLQCLG